MTAPGSRPERLNRLTVVVLFVLTSVGAILRFAGIGDKSLWIDEAYSVWVARQPLKSLWQTTVDLDLHTPLYYASLHVWLAFGEGETALRSLSALLGVLTLPVIFLIGDRIGGRTLGLLSTGLFALSPLHIAYAQQVRMYTMMTFFAALSILSLVLLLRQVSQSGTEVGSASGTTSGSNAPWVLFVLSTVLTMLSHNTGVLEPVAVAVFLAVVVIRSSWRRGYLGQPALTGPPRHPLRGVSGVATGLAAAFVLWMPWLPHFLAQSQRVDQEFWISSPTLSTFLDHWRDLVVAYGLGGAERNLLLLAALVLVAQGLSQLRRRPEMPVLLLLLVVVPVAVELLVSLRRPIFYTQTLIWTAIPLTVLLAAGMLRFRLRPVIALVAGVAVALNAVGIRNYHQSDGKEDWRGAVQYVAEHVRPGELVLFSAAWAQVPFDYYYPRFGGPPITQHGLPANVGEGRVLEARMSVSDLPRLDRLTTGRTTVWTVYSHDWYTDPRRLVPSRLSASFRMIESREFPGIVVVHHRTSPE